jgi:hypothetical protein
LPTWESALVMLDRAAKNGSVQAASALAHELRLGARQFGHDGLVPATPEPEPEQAEEPVDPFAEVDELAGRRRRTA